MRYAILAVVFAACAGVASIASPSIARAGCIGGAVGDACIGIPTPNHHPYPHRYENHERDGSVVIEHHHHHSPPVVIERHDEDDD